MPNKKISFEIKDTHFNEVITEARNGLEPEVSDLLTDDQVFTQIVIQQFVNFMTPPRVRNDKGIATARADLHTINENNAVAQRTAERQIKEAERAARNKAATDYGTVKVKIENI